MAFTPDQIAPVLPVPCISRENILDTIDQVFDGEIEVLVLESAEGIGKTVTAALYAGRHKTRVFTVFLRTGSRWAYDLDIVRSELCQQIAGAVGKILPDEES
jgi:hypothetical protein